MTDEDVREAIRQRLDDPDVTISRIVEDSEGAFAAIVVEGTEEDMHRILGEDFVVDTGPTNLGDRISVFVRPDW